MRLRWTLANPRPIYAPAIARLAPMFSRKVLIASVTPLASIFGSGFLIVVPVLERTLGAQAIFGIVGVSGFVWFVGTAVRHNVATAEPLKEAGTLDPATERVERAADLVIVVAYVISVALYLRIMAQYVVEFAGSGSDSAERGLASAAVAVIVAVGVTRGFSGLDLLERVALAAVLVITTVVGGALFLTDAADLIGAEIEFPPVPDYGLTHVLLVLGGIVITVQGFETVRYLADEYDRDTRIWACRLSQLVAASIYIGFVAVATPVMGLGTSDRPDASLLDITGRVVPLLSLPVVITAVLSQFSAATADTVAADGNLRRLFGAPMQGARPFVLSGAAATVLVWTVPTFTIIAVASRAFAAYYALECVIALRTSDDIRAKAGYGLLALVLLAITLLAKPAG